MARFREMRKRANIGLSEAAEFMGVTKQAVNAWERGENQPRVEMVKKMSELYRCSFDELLSESEVKQ